jgi:hypothetical protein
MIEHINPTKLSRTISSNLSNAKPVQVEPVEEKLSSNGKSLKKPGGRKKK